VSQFVRLCQLNYLSFLLELVRSKTRRMPMVLETLLVLLVLGAVVATVLSLFVVRSKKHQPEESSKPDADNPQWDDK
jgi:ABC-type thiamin/hydroxymethylpyrimidine transport system permease subunit